MLVHYFQLQGFSCYSITCLPWVGNINKPSEILFLGTFKWHHGYRKADNTVSGYIHLYELEELAYLWLNKVRWEKSFIHWERTSVSTWPTSAGTNVCSGDRKRKWPVLQALISFNLTKSSQSTYDAVIRGDEDSKYSSLNFSRRYLFMSITDLSQQVRELDNATVRCLLIVQKQDIAIFLCQPCKPHCITK